MEKQIVVQLYVEYYSATERSEVLIHLWIGFPKTPTLLEIA